MAFHNSVLYQGTTLEAAEKHALFEGYGTEAVHDCYVMNPALAAEGCCSSRNHPFSASSLAGPQSIQTELGSKPPAITPSAQTAGSGATPKKLKKKPTLYDGHRFGRAVKNCRLTASADEVRLST
jgi:hypothetical protein